MPVKTTGTPLIAFVEPGDILLFRPDSTAGWIIAVKTWSKDASHCEVVARLMIRDGDREVTTFTARGNVSKEQNGQTGVGFYSDLAQRAHRVSWVLRPSTPIGADKAVMVAEIERWSEQKYDYLGLAVFALAAAQGSHDKMHCGEAVLRFSRNLTPADPQWVPLHPNADADKTAPGTFLFSPSYTQYKVTDGRVYGPYLK